MTHVDPDAPKQRLAERTDPPAVLELIEQLFAFNFGRWRPTLVSDSNSSPSARRIWFNTGSSMLARWGSSRLRMCSAGGPASLSSTSSSTETVLPSAAHSEIA